MIRMRALRTTGGRGLLLVGAFLLFFSIIGASFGPGVQEAEAAGCTGPSISFGRWRWCGYWFNRFDDEGDSVRIGGVPSSVNTPDEFINLLTTDLGSGDRNHITGASFVIFTMIGAPMPWPPIPWSNPSTSHPTPNSAQINDWADRVRGYGRWSTIGNTSYGPNGSIEWWGSQHLACGSYNTYWQGNYSGANPDDVAPYIMSASNSDCNKAWVLDDVIVFRDTGGNEVYKIRRNCMNPLGTLSALQPKPDPDFALNPGISVLVNGSGSTGNVAEIGDTVTFRYSVNNTGHDIASGTSCTALAKTYAGYQPDPGSLSAPTSPAGVATGCPRDFPSGSTPLGDESFALTSANANQTICRSLTVDPASYGGGASAPAVNCVRVVSKPYTRAFGGDVAVGGGFTTAGTCSTESHASVLGWNKENGTFDGAGTRSAVYAMESIYDYASGQNSAGQPAPKSLSFGNTSYNTSSGWFGGDFGSAPCIPDYYGSRPTANETWTSNVTAMTDAHGGIYENSGQVTLGGPSGNINNNERISVYINGDLYIDHNITYGNSFNLSSMPLFQVVVKGNIYISRDVTQLDGVYIAQPDGGNKGIIYTCVDPGNPFNAVALSGSFYSTCNNKLTVNGSFVARQIDLMRTHGSLHNANAGETPASSNAGEVFNYGPAFWLQQPRGGGNNTGYDSITSLPPIL